MNAETQTEKPKKKPSRPRGRPKSAEVARDKVQSWLRSTDAEKRRWQKAADAAGIPLRTWMRLQLNAAIGATTPTTAAATSAKEEG